MRQHCFTRDRRGFSRILEVVIAAVIIFVAFSVATFLIQTSDVRVLQERADLDRLGYNVLSSMVNSGAVEVIESDSAYQNWMLFDRGTYLRTTVQSYLPVTMYFNLTLSNCTDMTTYAKQQAVANVTNTPSGLIENSTEVSSTDIIYTSKKGNVYHAILLLTRAGEGR
jgi:hypothetical protein